MISTERDTKVTALKEKLAELERRFQTEARRRGFDPAQVENMALPAALARLYEEYTALKMALVETEQAE